MRKRGILKKNKKEMVSLDSERAKLIINSKDVVQVLYQGSPVWLDQVKENNVVEVTRLDRKEKIEVPAYLLVENRSANI